MKKLNVLKYAIAITGALLLLISCNNDDDTVAEKNLIVGTWKMTAGQRISGKDGTILQNEEVTGCDTLVEYIFTREGTLTVTAYRKMTNGECEKDETRDETGTYTYDAFSNTITLAEEGNNSSLTLDVPVLTTTEMQFKQHGRDYNDDGIDDFYIFVFNK